MKRYWQVFAFVNTVWVGAAQGNSEYEQFKQAVADGICSVEYAKCLNLSQRQCSQISLKAIESCPSQRPRGLDYEVLDSVCSTNAFIEFLGLPDEHVQKCDSVLEERMKVDGR